MTDIVDVLRLPGNYKITAKEGGQITLDVGTGALDSRGTVTITGNLDVQGKTTYVESSDLTVKDNIIILNQGGYNANHFINVGGGTSGIVVDRGGDGYNGKLYLDDSPGNGTWIDLNNGTHNGIWHFKNDGGASVVSVAGIRLDTQGIASSNLVNGSPRLVLIGPDSAHADAVVSVKGTVDYETNVTDDDDIPNKKYVDDKFDNTSVDASIFANVLIDSDSLVVIPDLPSLRPRSFITVTPSGPGGSGKISAFIDSYLTMEVSADNVQLAGLSVAGSTIQPFFTGTNIYLTTDNAEVVIDSAVTYQAVTTPPAASPNQVKVYSTSTAGAGGTGLMFVNPNVEDELVSSRKMMIYSIIF